MISRFHTSFICDFTSAIRSALKRLARGNNTFFSASKKLSCGPVRRYNTTFRI